MQKNKRIIDRKVIDKLLDEKPVCEVCRNTLSTDPHHLMTRGSGGGDVRENIVIVCRNCHTAIHNGLIDRMQLLKIVSLRERKTVDEIEEVLIKMRQGSNE